MKTKEKHHGPREPPANLVLRWLFFPSTISMIQFAADLWRPTNDLNTHWGLPSSKGESLAVKSTMNLCISVPIGSMYGLYTVPAFSWFLWEMYVNIPYMDPMGTGKKENNQTAMLLYCTVVGDLLPSDVQCSNLDIQTSWVAEGILISWLME